MQRPDIAQTTNEFRRRFLAAKPVRTASLIVTLFGDAVVPRDGELSIRALIDLIAAIGIEAGAVRTAMSRLVADGLFERRNGGKRPGYGLSPTGGRTFAAAFKRVYAGERPAVGGGFRILVVPPAAKKSVNAGELEAAGYRLLSAGTFVAPASAPPVKVPDGAFLFEASAEPDMAHRVATGALGLAATAAAYRRFVAEHEPLLQALEAGGKPPRVEAFVLRTLAVHAFRRTVIRDPGLPEDLLPPDRPDLQARQMMSALYATVAEASEAHIDAVTEADGEPLGRLTIDLKRRFQTV